MKKIALLGSTGSIGVQVLNAVRQHPNSFKVVAMAAYSESKAFTQQIKEFSPKLYAVASKNRDAALEVAGYEEADIVFNAVSGFAGVEYSVRAIKAGKNLALANKETLVCGGEYITRLAKANGVEIIPVDSEHSAIWQCLEGYVGHGAPAGLILTCSGGALREAGAEEIANADVERTLRHPTWKMGAKITVDSATLLNKGLEIIEAHWLFDMPYERISAVIHPESIVHSMVQYADGALLAQMSYPDMRLPIQYALSYPKRWPNSLKPLDFARLGSLSFGAVDEERFPCFRLAKEAGKAGGTLPAVLSGANEVLVGAFLKGKGPLGLIPRGLEAVLGAHNRGEQTELANIIEADRWAREYAGRWLIKQGF